jgi:hypothetical protein
LDISSVSRPLVELFDELLGAIEFRAWRHLRRPRRPVKRYDRFTGAALTVVLPVIEKLERETATVEALDAKTFEPVTVPGAFWRNTPWVIRHDPPAIGGRQQIRNESAHGIGPHAFRWQTEWLYLEPRLIIPAETAEQAMARALRKLQDNQAIDASMSTKEKHRAVLQELGKSEEKGFGYENFRKNVIRGRGSN